MQPIRAVLYPASFKNGASCFDSLMLELLRRGYRSLRVPSHSGVCDVVCVPITFVLLKI